MSTLWTAIAMLLVIGTGAAHALEVSKAAPATVIAAADTAVAEHTAAREVADHLGKVTGAATTAPPRPSLHAWDAQASRSLPGRRW